MLIIAAKDSVVPLAAQPYCINCLSQAPLEPSQAALEHAAH